MRFHSFVGSQIRVRVYKRYTSVKWSRVYLNGISPTVKFSFFPRTTGPGVQTRYRTPVERSHVRPRVGPV